MLSQRIKAINAKAFSKNNDSIFSKAKRFFIEDKKYEEALKEKEMFNSNYSCLARLQSHFQEMEKNPNFSSKNFEIKLKDFYEIIQAGSTSRLAMVTAQLKKEGFLRTEFRMKDNNGIECIYPSSMDLPDNYDTESNQAECYCIILN